MWTLALVLLLTGGQDAKPKPDAPAPEQRVELKRVDAVILPQGADGIVRHKTGKRIRRVENSNEECLRIVETPGDPRFILIEGLRPGIARLTLTDEENVVDKLIAIVEKQAGDRKK